MAIVYATKNGNWSDVTVWNTGALPLADDDVYADGKTVTIDQDVTVLSIRNDQRSGGILGGNFVIQSLRTITANLTGGFLVTNYTSTGVTIIGNVQPNLALGDGQAILRINGGDITVIGNVTGPNGSGGFTNGTIYITAGTVNVIGSVFGGFQNSNSGISFRGGVGGTLNLTGNCTGGDTGIASNAISVFHNNVIINVIGTAFAGLSASSVSVKGGALNPNVYIETVSSNASDVTLAAVDSYSYLSGRVTIKNAVFNAFNNPPFTRFVYFLNSSEIITTVAKENNTQVTLIDLANLPNELPNEANVRQGTVYNSTNKVGTLAVPDPSNVRKDIPTDNTVGTAELTGEDILQALNDSTLPLAVRLKNVATVQALGDVASSI